MKKLFAGGIIILSIVIASNAPAAFWEDVKEETTEAASSVKEISKDWGENIKKEAKEFGQEVKKDSRELGHQAAEKTKQAPGFFEKMGHDLKSFGGRVKEKVQKLFDDDDEEAANRLSRP